MPPAPPRDGGDAGVALTRVPTKVASKIASRLRINLDAPEPPLSPARAAAVAHKCVDYLTDEVCPTADGIQIRIGTVFVRIALPTRVWRIVETGATGSGPVELLCELLGNSHGDTLNVIVAADTVIAGSLG